MISYLVRTNDLLTQVEKVFRNPTGSNAWTDTNAMVTIQRFIASGPHQGRSERIEHPDGTWTTFAYGSQGGDQIVTNRFGSPSGSQVSEGMQTVTVSDALGRWRSRTRHQLVSGTPNHLIGQDIRSPIDGDESLGWQVVSLGNRTNQTDISCCGSSGTLSIDEDGVETTHLRDVLRRPIGSMRLGITETNHLDVAGQIYQRIRKGTNGNVIVKDQHAYDNAGRLLSSINTLGATNSFTYGNTGTRLQVVSQSINGSLHRVEQWYPDGRLERVTGSGVHPVRFDYGITNDSGAVREFIREIHLTTNGTDTASILTRLTDGFGNTYKTLYPGGAYEESWFNTKGQRYMHRDADGVFRLFEYNSLGEETYSALRMGTSGSTIQLSADRVTRTLQSYTTNALGMVIRRVETRSLPNFGATNEVVMSVSEASVDGLRTWHIASGLTNSTVMAYAASGFRYVTNTLPDNSRTIQELRYGRLQSVTRRNSGGTQIGKTSYTYDAHGRQATVTDARNGTTTYTYNAADMVLTLTQPAPGTGQPAPVTTTTYDTLGRAIRLTQPDGTTVTNEFFLTGLLKKTSGSRTYPVEYTYDAQGRMTTMKTWTNAAAGTGAATTTWAYDAARGWLTNKLYHGQSVGTAYSYTSGGRIKTRTWSRTYSGSNRIITTYKYGFDDIPTTNQHPDLVEISYNDGLTPTLSHVHDRLGRQIQSAYGTNQVQRFFTTHGLLLSESHSAGTLNGLNVTNTYDALLRRQSLTVRNGGTILGRSITYGYDSASRLESVSDATNSCTYTYVANSPLWQTLTFKNVGSPRLTVGRQFDFNNRLLAITNTPSSGSALSYQYQYNLAGQRTRRTDADNSYWVYQYDKLGQVVSGRRYWSDGTPVAGQQYGYAYDDIGNRTGSGEGGTEDPTAPLRTTAYTVNLLNQLTGRTNPSAVDVLGAANAGAEVRVNGLPTLRRGEYFHRELGVTNASGPAWTPVTVNAMQSGTTNTNSGNLYSPPVNQALVYDADGNLLHDGLWVYQWDAENRLLSVTSTNTVPSAGRRQVGWAYDAGGRRVRQTQAIWSGSSYTNAVDQKLLHDGWACVAELSSANSLQRQYIWGLDLSGTMTGAGGVGGLLWMLPSGGAARFAAYDGNGNVMGLVQDNGQFKAWYEYDPFGRTIRETTEDATTAHNPYKFSTKRAEAYTGLILYEFRIYDPVAGRWLNRDPIGESGGANLFVFVYNNPLTYLDYLGMEGDTYGELRDALLDDDATADFYKVCKTITTTGKTIIEITPHNSAVELITGRTIAGDDGSRIAAGAGLVFGWMKPIKKFGGACCGKVKKCVVGLFKTGRKVPVVGGLPLQPGSAYKGITKDGKVVEIREIMDSASHPDLAKRADALIDPNDYKKGLKKGVSPAI